MDGFETDVHLTQDGKLVLCHNYTIDKTSNGKGSISQMTLGKLKTFDFGSYFSPKFADTRIPALRELLELVADDPQIKVLNIELKSPRTNETSIVRDTIAMVKEYGLFDKMLMSSFDPKLLLEAKRIDPKTKTGFLYSPNSKFQFRIYRNPLEFAKSIGVDALHPFSMYVNADLVHENYVVENIAVDEYDNHVQVVNAEMIRARDRYCRGVSVWISANNSVDFHVLSCTYSWGSCSAHAVPTPGDSGFGCYCISDTKDVTVQVIATYEVDGVVYTKTRTASIDLTARFGEEHTGYSVDKNRVISITMGWWYEP